MTYYTHLESPTGILLLVGDGQSLSGIHFADQPNTPITRAGWVEDKSKFAKAIAQLQSYFAGTLRQFDIPLNFAGTDFQRAVWQELLQIPYGKQSNYKTIAINVGRPKAVRAVGNAIGKNPICIVIPCHRVIASNGTMGGFSGGLDNKYWLLQLEASHAQPV